MADYAAAPLSLSRLRSVAPFAAFDDSAFAIFAFILFAFLRAFRRLMADSFLHLMPAMPMMSYFSQIQAILLMPHSQPPQP
jgi:hypothetical protein